jgi:hypothetical protein
MWEVGFIRYTPEEIGFGPYGTDPASYSIPSGRCRE